MIGLAGLYDTDIMFDLNYGVIIDSKGDLATVTELECFIQDVRMEAITTEGDVFYDKEYANIDEMLELELEQRIQMKLERRKEVDVESLRIHLTSKQATDIDRIYIKIFFRTINNDPVQIEIALDRLKVEVVNIG